MKEIKQKAIEKIKSSNLKEEEIHNTINHIKFIVSFFYLSCFLNVRKTRKHNKIRRLMKKETVR